MLNHLRKFFHNPASRSVGIVFAMSGLSFGTWATFIPFVKERFHLDEAQLGLILLCLPLGNFIANPLTVFLIRKYGAVRIALLFGALTSFFFAITISSSWLAFGSVGLFLAGASFGCSNVAMNTCASALEDQGEHRVMSACHGMWSVGAMCGALFSGLSLIPLRKIFDQGLSPQTVYVFILAVMIMTIIWFTQSGMNLIKEKQIEQVSQPKMHWKAFRPGKTLWTLIIICLCTYLTEGTIADWSAVYMREITLASVTMAGWGFAIYAFFMAGGRFMGDQLIGRYGAMKVLCAGGVLVLAGLILVILSQNPWPTLPGFMLIGMGISNASPILYGSAAKMKDKSPGVGLATLNTFAMASFLGGPVLIGFIAKMVDLRIAFMLVALTAVIWIIQTARVIRMQ